MKFIDDIRNTGTQRIFPLFLGEAPNAECGEQFHSDLHGFSTSPPVPFPNQEEDRGRLHQKFQNSSISSFFMVQVTLWGGQGSSSKNSGSRSSCLVNPAARLKACSVFSTALPRAVTSSPVRL